MHATAWACARALLNAGNSTAIRIAMIPMTTSNSTNVNPAARFALE
jgi:hypothetical protein